MNIKKRMNRVNLGKHSREQGFTLIEIMVVIAILALLAVMVVPQVFNQLQKAQATRVASDIRAVESALKNYRIDNYKYPSQSEGLAALVQAPANVRNWNGPYLDDLPTDPWDAEYRYANPGVNGKEIEVFTFGADNAEGGEGVDSDLGSWNIK